jgi:hypothetical protein
MKMNTHKKIVRKGPTCYLYVKNVTTPAHYFKLLFEQI